MRPSETPLLSYLNALLAVAIVIVGGTVLTYRATETQDTVESASVSASVLEQVDGDTLERKEGDTDLIPGVRREGDQVVAFGRALSVIPALAIFGAAILFALFGFGVMIIRKRRFEREDAEYERQRALDLQRRRSLS